MIVNSFCVNLHILHIFNNGCVVLKDFVRFDQKRLDKRGKMAYNKKWKIAVYRGEATHVPSTATMEVKGAKPP